ncbi:hypothetical protein DEU56DRAFT_824889 [Suillus clintonianus]|uniref:uncharacterized protein n=1 Tax=Suillus clintonianus TaxID=1904413 RepID=UPI001B879C34|nr:uncharacterized protein DEU56DRAFT_824889 [Suillus clintonianus]KAG2125502.1 hypothetical protein DEU56DRAFT_824889 [Suillus clintonianus]
MSSRPHHTAAVAANAKIFPVFANRLASHDINEYINTANKLKNWLGSEKAYYPDALRNIAHKTFTKQFLHAQSSARAAMDIYRALIHAVVPFLLRLQDLIQSSSEISTQPVYPVRAEGEATPQEYRDTSSVFTTAQDTTPSTQLRFPSTAQVELVQSPTTTQISTTIVPCSDIRTDPPPSASLVRTFPKPQPKRQSVASSLSEQLKNRDLEWFKAQHQPAASPDPRPVSPVVDSAAPLCTLDLSHDATELPAEKLRPSRVPKRVPPQPVSSESMTANEPTAPANVVDLSSISSFTEASTPMDVKKLKEEEITPAIADVIMSDPLPEIVPQGSETLPLGIPENVASGVTTQSPKPNTDSPALRQPPEITSDDVGAESREEELPSSPVDNTPPQVNCPRFGGEMAVMMFRQGLESPRGVINLPFNLDDTLYLQIARWAKRKSSPIDLEQSVCVSFACYHLPSLLPNPPEDDQLPPFETLTMHSQCSWPTSGDLSLQTKRDGKDFVIPLSPPIFVTPDNCVDISAFIRSGENAFSVVQQSEMSDYMFVLHAHHPTPAQLSYLASCRQRRENWLQTTRAFCTPEPMESLWRRSPLRS